MGKLYTLQCEHCGNEWDHYEGVGDSLQPYAIEDLEGNETCDTQGDIKCPNCQSTEWEAIDEGSWD